MNQYNANFIPSVNLSLDENIITKELDDAFIAYGFCVITDTGISEKISKAMLQACRNFHMLDYDTKNNLSINAYHRGYIAPETSTIFTSSVSKVTQPNTSSSFMIMHDVNKYDPRYGTDLQGPNQWPQELQDFKASIQSYQREIQRVARRLILILFKVLGVSFNDYLKWFSQPTEFLRLLQYTAPTSVSEKKYFGSAPHTDHGFITLVLQDDIGGLEVESRQCEWLPILTGKSGFVVNVADLLAHLSNNRWRSSPHRVKNPVSGSRYSVAYFFDPCMEANVTSCGGSIINYGDYILSKFDTNYDYRRG